MSGSSVSQENMWLWANVCKLLRLHPHFPSTHPHVAGNQLAVLTPNVVEFGRLARACGVDTDGSRACAELVSALRGPAILQKGRSDVAADAEDQVQCSEPGSLRRVGG